MANKRYVRIMARREAEDKQVQKELADFAAVPEHDCMENAVPYESDGAIGHGFECGICGKFLQAG